jgi:hypothetical protein
MTCDIAIIGSGPYGLAAASHLRAANFDTHVFGRPMDFWEQQMPAGMCLRSPARASNISDPQGCLTLHRYSASEGVPLPAPIPLRSFVEYGRWFQKRVVPDLDTRRVDRIERSNGRFQLTLGDRDTLEADRVVVAAGISLFARQPAEFDGLPEQLVSHSSAENDLGRYAGRRTIVIGGGQSALESAALLREAGADVEVVLRRPIVHWLDQRASWLKSEANPLRGLFYPPTDVGPPGLNQLVAAPDLFRRLPRRLQDPIAYRCIRPAGAGWLVSRMGGVRITTGRTVLGAAARGQEIRLILDDGTMRGSRDPRHRLPRGRHSIPVPRRITVARIARRERIPGADARLRVVGSRSPFPRRARSTLVRAALPLRRGHRVLGRCPRRFDNPKTGGLLECVARASGGRRLQACVRER